MACHQSKQSHPFIGRFSRSITSVTANEPQLYTPSCQRTAHNHIMQRAEDLREPQSCRDGDYQYGVCGWEGGGHHKVPSRSKAIRRGHRAITGRARVSEKAVLPQSPQGRATTLQRTTIVVCHWRMFATRYSNSPLVGWVIQHVVPIARLDTTIQVKTQGRWDQWG